ncbi:MAG: prolyl oligopeptidase family serine peptidase [Dehalococcoidales bacterium]|nr:prolyl oligopeptidase family serine peptidase [Dehalococcoidales bacterium]
MSLTVDGLRIAGRLYLPDTVPCSIVCVCHGIPASPEAEDSNSNDGGYPRLAERIRDRGLGAFIFNFRGTRDSGGNFDILGWTRDLRAVIDYLWSLPEIDGYPLSLLGFSGGATVSIYVAAADARVASVVACACPAEFVFGERTPQGIVEHFRRIGLIRDADFPASVDDWSRGFKKVSPVRYIAGIAPRPLLLVHGSRDEVVNVSQAYRLRDNAGDPKQLVIIDGAGHRLRLDDKAMTVVIDWLKSQC